MLTNYIDVILFGLNSTNRKVNMKTKSNLGILIITTGGTIDKIYGTGKGVREFSWAGDPAISLILKEARVIAGYSLLLLLRKDSLDMDAADRREIVESCLTNPHKRILITHGTDTMHKTAEAIAKKCKDKTIVLTGASQPAAMKITDANFNVGFAFSATSLAGPGIYIAMNGRLHVWNRCRKNDQGIFESI
jgi:L-asparaginase